MEESATTFELVLTVHSVLRWGVIALVVLSFLQALGVAVSGDSAGEKSRLLGVLTVVALDVQVLIGIVLHVWLSPTTRQGMQDMGGAMKDPVQRFWVVEHGVTMLLALVAIHAGRVWARRASGERGEGLRGALTLGLGLVLILVGTPWPFRQIGIARGWLTVIGF